MILFQCGINNFKRRDECFKCGTRKEELSLYEENNQLVQQPTNGILNFTFTKKTLQFHKYPTNAIKILLKIFCHHLCVLFLNTTTVKYHLLSMLLLNILNSIVTS